MAFFEKYPGRPEGRPVGVRDGQGAKPQGTMNPVLGGMKHTQTPLGTPAQPAQARPRQAEPPQPPALPEGTVETLISWASKNLGGR